ncbi:hypothetical protein M9H77_23242 [Catharanthus roseus]|uniref:Uncharacterized protein n=1 Tax=Catharanthus roseus TaxID=4058 RepID=A0ACC0ATP3_CATRO|nr:hypothetical protein M9H77_23242 [Catharanthus roseus]
MDCVSDWVKGDTFQTTAAYTYFTLASPKQSSAKIVWNPTFPPKFSFIMWLTVLGRLPMMDRLKFLEVDRTCSLCKQNEETLSHLFFACPFTDDTWAAVREWARLLRRMTTMNYIISKIKIQKLTGIKLETPDIINNGRTKKIEEHSRPATIGSHPTIPGSSLNKRIEAMDVVIMKLDELIRALQADELPIPGRQHDKGIVFRVNANESNDAINDKELMLMAKNFNGLIKRA